MNLFLFLLALILDCVLVIRLGGVIRLPARCGEDMLVPLVPRAQHNLACVRLVFLHAGVGYHTNVLVNVEREERPAFAARLKFKQEDSFSRARIGWMRSPCAISPTFSYLLI